MKKVPKGTAPRLIGLTGAYCAGKNHVARLLEARGLETLDVDTLGHRTIETEREAILNRFGPSVAGKDGAIDRRLLGERVFGRPDELAALEGIVHPAVNRLTEAWISSREREACVINAALLHRSSVFTRLDCIILVRSSLLTRLFRARKRDRLPLIQLIRRFRSQKKIIAQYLRKNTDTYTKVHIIHNRGCFGACSGRYRRNLENRIDDILSREGLV
jgi:dephospho-CoA kinase